MKHRGRLKVLLLGLSLSLLVGGQVFAADAEPAASAPAGQKLTVAGTVSNISGKALGESTLSFSLNGQPLEGEYETSSSGTFDTTLELPAGSLPAGQLTMEVKHAGYVDATAVKIDAASAKDGSFLANVDTKLKRAKTPAFFIATIILLLVYVIIASEAMHRTLAAMLCASAILFISYTVGTFNPDYFILSFEGAVKSIDMNVIFLLMAMMIIVGVLKKTGVFQWLAYRSYLRAGGNIYVLASILMVVTAVTSAFLDNVTTMLLMIPVTIEICVTLKINPVAVLLPEAFASNIGGTATLIGDPPNIMIGSYAKLTFMDFVHNLTIPMIICTVVTVIYFILWYKKEYQNAHMSKEEVQSLTEKLKEEYQITNSKLLVQSSIILLITIGMFICHGFLHMEPSVAALIGAAVLLVISKVDIVEMLEHEVEWPTLIFFMMLFVVVAGAEETGLIQIIADWVNSVSGGSLTTAAVIILWVSAIASAFIDNIPFTATMLPIVAYLNTILPGAESGVLWWALAMGACLGGNGTMIGASANVVTVGMAEKAGYPISFMYYLKAAFIPMLITVTICMGWMLMFMM